MLAYTALVIDNGNITDKTLHYTTWEVIKSLVAPGDFIELTEINEYRVKQFQDPSAFRSILGFYEVKYLYILFAKFLNIFFDPLAALRLVSVFSVALTGMITFLWFKHKPELLLVAIVILITADFGRVAINITPDIFAGILLIMGCYFFIRQIAFLSTILFLLAIAARPDHTAFVMIFFLISIWFNISVIKSLMGMILSLAVYLTVTSVGNHPGWWVHMLFTHIKYEPTLVDFNPPFSILTYLEILLRASVRSLIGETWLALLIVEVIVFTYLLKEKISLSDRQLALLFAIFISIPIKFMVFPTFETRFHAPYIIVAGFLILNMLFEDQNKSIKI